MRVLLFVQYLGRPTYIGDAYGEDRSGPRHKRRVEIEHTGHFIDALRDDMRKDCDRWWLVECESAANGREVIAYAEPDPPGTSKVAAWPRGRILASGGRAA